MGDPSPYLGLTFCCVIPTLWTVAMFAFGIYYERNGGLPWRVVRRTREERIEDLEDGL